MGFLSSESMDVSPIQHHPAHLCTEIFWSEGELESLGDPHRYINQEGLNFLQLNTPRLVPWQYTGLPTSTPTELLVRCENVHLLYFPKEETQELYKAPPNTLELVLYFPLFVIQAQVPLLGEAKLENFLEFWKGSFVPASDASIHFLVGGPSRLPRRVPLLYVNRRHLQGYVKP
ncbi:MAG: hypothetical protein ACP5HM_09410 [Anaerolineae bacterium]